MNILLNRTLDAFRGIVRWVLDRRIVRLAIVRKYADANGNYIGELYIEREHKGISGYDMIGVSLDSMPLGTVAPVGWTLDTRNDFLAPMLVPNVIRVGALEPSDNDGVRRMMGKLPRRCMTLVVQNRFIQDILSGGQEKRFA